MIMKYGRRYGRIYIILCFITEDRVERWSDEKGGGGGGAVAHILRIVA